MLKGMCGRFTLRTPADELAEQFALLEIPDLTPRYNIAPTQLVGTVRLARSGSREWTMMKWGLVPSWSAEEKGSARMINARSESAVVAPAFRGPMRKRRCLIVADGFYEWKPLDKGKQPMYVHRHDRKPFAFAGLWD